MPLDGCTRYNDPNTRHNHTLLARVGSRKVCIESGLPALVYDFTESCGDGGGVIAGKGGGGAEGGITRIVWGPAGQMGVMVVLGGTVDPRI